MYGRKGCHLISDDHSDRLGDIALVRCLRKGYISVSSCHKNRNTLISLTINAETALMPRNAVALLTGGVQHAKEGQDSWMGR